MKKPVVAIAGNPNSGKTTLFNLLTGSRQKVGNWPGVTVDKKIGIIADSRLRAEIVDLPGIYSLNAWSEDERIAHQYLFENEADLIVQVLDSTNLERNLYLTSQLQEMGLPLLLILNMADLAQAQGIRINTAKLSDRLGEPVIMISAVQTDVREQVVEAIARALQEKDRAVPKPIQIPEALREEVELLTPALEDAAKRSGRRAQWIALKLLENDPLIESWCVTHGWIDSSLLLEARERIASSSGLYPDEWTAEARYHRIESDLKACGIRRATPGATLTDLVDSLVLHKIWGFPFFLLVMYSIFWLTINLGGAFIDFFDQACRAVFVDGAERLLLTLKAPPALIALIAHGIGTGIQTLSTFIPIIFTLFFVVSALESSGYMARAALVMDRLMRTMGLPGKAFIPMLLGFGCTVPALMATRTLENRRDRILSVFMVPFMSCGARLPVYVLFAAAFFPQHGQNIIFALYLTGIILAVLTGLLLKKTVYRGELSHFIMELPPYHRPMLSAMLRQAGFRLKSFLKKGGRVLLPIIAILGIFNSIGTDGSLGNQDTPHSVLSTAGKAVTPLFTPMGISQDNWPAAVGLFTGLFAKEAIVGTLNALYAQGNPRSPQTPDPASGDPPSLGSALKEAWLTIPENLKNLGNTLLDPLGFSGVNHTTEQAQNLGVDAEIFKTMRESFNHSQAAAIAYLLFVLLYVPCVVATSTAWKEIGGTLTFLQGLYSTVLGWTLATFTYQVLAGRSTAWIAVSIFILVATIIGIVSYAQYSGHFRET